jgi:hypothetical protein
VQLACLLKNDCPKEFFECVYSKNFHFINHFSIFACKCEKNNDFYVM